MSEYPSPPEGIRVLSNGAGYCEVDKKIKFGPGTFGPNPHAITSSNAAEMRKIARDKAKQAILDAIVEQTKEHGIDVFDGPEALGYAIGVLFREVLESKGTLRDRNRVVWDIAKYSGLTEDKKQGVNQQTNVQVNINLDVLRKILDSVGGDVIDL